MIKQLTYPGPFAPLMTEKELKAIQQLIIDNNIKISVIVELGTYEGGTTIAMSEVADPATKIYTVEPFVTNRDSIRERTIENLKKYPNIELMEMTSMQAAHQFFQPVDLLFIDADHQDDHILRDLSAWIPKINPGGFLITDDYANDYFPAVKRRVDEQTQGWKVIAEVDTIKIFQKPS